MELFYIELKPTPSNTAYATRIIRNKRSRLPASSPGAWTTYRFLLPHLVIWKDECRDLILTQYKNSVNVHQPLFLCVYVLWNHSDLYFKNGNLQPKDLSGHLKLLEDCVAEVIGIDDSYNFEIILKKVPSNGDTRLVISLSYIHERDQCEDQIRDFISPMYNKE